MAAPPDKAEISAPFPNPSNATARAGFGKLWETLFGSGGLLGTTGNAAEARQALGIGPVISFRNRIINGGFNVNQRVVSGSVVLAAGAYGHDRWKAGAAGCSYTFATVAGVTTITITAGSLVQVIEGLNVEGGTYTVSRTGTAQGRVLGGTYASAPFQITGVVGGANLSVEFGTGTLSFVQVEPGASATPFERRPFSLERSLCQPYYSKSYAYATAPGANTGITGGIEDGPGLGVVFTNLVYRVLFPVPSRTATPSVQIYDAAGLPGYVTLFNPTQNNAQAPTGVDNLSERGFKVFSSAASPQRICFHWVMTNEL